MVAFERIEYRELNGRQQENYNFQKVAGRMASYGYNCIRLNDDWQGADFLAVHVNGSDILRVQLKGRLTIDRKYEKKDLHIAFLMDESGYVFPHDPFVAFCIKEGRLKQSSKHWAEKGQRSWPSTPRWALDWLKPYKV